MRRCTLLKCSLPFGWNAYNFTLQAYLLVRRAGWTELCTGLFRPMRRTEPRAYQHSSGEWCA